MSNRWMNQFRFSLEKKPVDLFAQVTIGSTGACTLVAAKSKGIKSITRSSAGTYVLTYSDTYQRLLDMDVTSTNSTGISAAPNVGVKATTTASVTFVCSTGGVATDPASGDTLNIRVSLSDSSAV